MKSSPTSTEDLSGPPTYEAVSTDNTGLTMTRRVHQHDPKEVIPNDQWAFADCTNTPFPGEPSTTKVCLEDGFDTNHIYELVYTAKNPTVAGIGFAATRDIISFLRNSNGDFSPTDAEALRMQQGFLAEEDPTELSARIAEAREDGRPTPPASTGVIAKRWRHKKRGSTYTEIGRGKLQVGDHFPDMSPVVIYQATADGTLWVRPESEFMDGRFEEIL